MVSLAQHILSGLPHRFTKDDVRPERLACLFMIDTMIRPFLPAFRQTIAGKLLDYTIACALQSSPWYQESYGRQGFDVHKIFTLQELAQLPVIDRSVLEHEGHRLRASTLNFGSAAFTTGTTSLRPLIVDNSIEEHQFVREFFSIMRQGQSSAGRIGLNLTNTYHGQLVDIPTAFRRIPVSANTLSGLRTAQALLQRDYSTAGGRQRVSAIGGPLIALLRLTAFLEAEQSRASMPAIDFIQSTSEYLTPAAQQSLKNFWNCPVEDRYGLSEIIIGAWRCSACGHHHFESYGIAEVVGMKDHIPITEGRGRLLLTGFAPFMQMTPLIRYLTGDGIEIVPTPCETGEQSFRLLGRLRNSLVYKGKLLLGEYEVMDILDGEPDVFRHKMYRYLPDYLQEVGSPPQFQLSIDENGLPLLTIQLRYDPQASDPILKNLQQRIATALAAKGLHAFIQDPGEPVSPLLADMRGMVQPVRVQFIRGSDEVVMF